MASSSHSVKGSAETVDDVSDSSPAQNVAALIIGLFFVGFGLPVWWRTTEVYRASLSHTEIEALMTTPLVTLAELEVVVLAPEENVPGSNLALFGQRLKEEMEISTEGSQMLKIDYRGQVRRASEAEFGAAAHASNLETLDRNLRDVRGPEKPGRSLVYLCSSTSFALPTPYVGVHRAAFLPINRDTDLSDMVSPVNDIVRALFVNEPAVFHAFHNAQGSMRLEPDKESMRALKSATEYQLTFTLLVPNPNEMVPVRWNIADAVDAHLQPLIDRLNPFASLHVDSQVLYYVSLPMRPHFDANNSRYYLTPDDLPHIVNPVEAKLVSHVNTRQIIHFLVYVPPPEHSPLFIYDEGGKPAESNAFISARWGGMIVVNSERGPTSLRSPSPILLDTHFIMEIFLSQLRSLLHFDTASREVSTIPSLVVAEPRDAALTEWELDAWLRRRGLENVATSSATLKSLSDLLEKIHNIVINDEIGADVEAALLACKTAGSLMKSGRLTDAYVSSKKALDSSEKAFFDPSLLELLYFPDDQKFAIYMPLFLPIGLPIATSLYGALKWLKGKKYTADEKKQQ